VPTVINGLPAHVLLIHVVVILVPLGALFTVLSAVWPAARRKLGFISPLTCLIALVFVPITTHAGEFLKEKLGESPAIKKHADLGDTLLPWAIGLFVISAAVWWLGRMADAAASTTSGGDAPSGRDARSGGATALATRMSTRVELPTWVTVAVAVVAIAVSVIITVQLIRIGDSGAQAVWGSTLK
jgi:hypothetical protein